MKSKIKLLTKKQLLKFAQKNSEWKLTLKDTAITQTFSFKNHIDALVFIARITVYAQVQNHHPDILFTFKKVKVTLTTKEVKGITQNDVLLAEKISKVQKSG